MISSSGPKVSKRDLFWVVWSPRVSMVYTLCFNQVSDLSCVAAPSGVKSKFGEQYQEHWPRKRSRRLVCHHVFPCAGVF